MQDLLFLSDAVEASPLAHLAEGAFGHHHALSVSAPAAQQPAEPAGTRKDDHAFWMQQCSSYTARQSYFLQ